MTDLRAKIASTARAGQTGGYVVTFEAGVHPSDHEVIAELCPLGGHVLYKHQDEAGRAVVHFKKYTS